MDFNQCKFFKIKIFFIKKIIKHNDSSLENFKFYAFVVFFTQLINITYVKKFQ